MSKERRTLRVLFTLDDPRDELRPGMFADVGLGTDERQALLIPADAVLHVGHSDYVLVAADSDNWKISEVKVSEQHDSRVEIRDGLHEGDRVIGVGAILLKPAVVRCLQRNDCFRSGGR